MSEVLVKVEDVSKKFCKNLKRTMLYGLQEIMGNMLGVRESNGDLRKGEFWAVDNVSFELKRGECLGLIGSNGAGKSTLLKMLNGIIAPDNGRIMIKGRVGALIEVTAGFHPMLTGRENIYIKGSILGLSKKEIDKKIDDIIEFSELGDFIDSPVKHYSSGMNVRLGFSIATQMEPDVLLIDEILAVGDVGFKAKCFNAIARLVKNAAVIFVSHSMPQVARVCSHVCSMEKGKVTYLGADVPKGIEFYYSQFKAGKGIVTGNGKATIHKIELTSNGKRDITQINYLDDLTVILYVTVDPDVKDPNIGIYFLSRELQIIAQCSSMSNKIPIHNTGDPFKITINLPRVNFNPGIYMISASVTDETRVDVLALHYAIKELKVCGEYIGRAPINLAGEWEVKQGGIKWHEKYKEKILGEN